MSFDGNWDYFYFALKPEERATLNQIERGMEHYSREHRKHVDMRVEVLNLKYSHIPAKWRLNQIDAEIDRVIEWKRWWRTAHWNVIKIIKAHGFVFWSDRDYIHPPSLWPESERYDRQLYKALFDLNLKFSGITENIDDVIDSLKDTKTKLGSR